MTDFLKIAKSIVVHFAHICAYGVETEDSLKSTETREEFSTTCNPKVMSRCLSAPDATSLHHCLQNHCPIKLNSGVGH